jgi:hypothetical protein
MTYWLKIGYFTDSQEAAPDYWMKRSWVSDSPGSTSPWWERYDRPRKGKKYPPHGPQYKVGDRLVIYITEKGVCPAILEVVGEPHWDPGWVDAQSGRREGEEWGVVTEVKGLWSRSLESAPPLEDIGGGEGSCSAARTHLTRGLGVRRSRGTDRKTAQAEASAKFVS